MLEENICKALSLTGVNIVPNDLHACHRMKRSDRVTVKFKCCKQKDSVMYKQKSLELSNLKFSGELFVSESMSWKSELTLTQFISDNNNRLTQMWLK